MQVLNPAGAVIRLHDTDLVAQGGEARVYRVGNTAYKLFHDPTRVPSQDRIAELQQLQDLPIVVPQGQFTDLAGCPLGLVMPFVTDAEPLARFAIAGHQQRTGVDAATLWAWLKTLGHALERAHQRGFVGVDLTGHNLLVDRAQRRIVVIDADAWQTPSHPASAQSDGVRDWQYPGLSPATDWFAFAVTTCTVLCGVHPFRGRHPSIRGLRHRMQQQVSIFHPEVVVPPCARLAHLPTEVRAWFVATFDRRSRTPPPDCPWQPGLAHALQSSAPPQLQIHWLLRGRVDDLRIGPTGWAALVGGIWRGPGGPLGVGRGRAVWTDRGRPMDTQFVDRVLRFFGDPVPEQLTVHVAHVANGALLSQQGVQIHRWRFTDRGPRAFAIPTPVATVRPATQWFDRCWWTPTPEGGRLGTVDPTGCHVEQRVRLAPGAQPVAARGTPDLLQWVVDHGDQQTLHTAVHGQPAHAQTLPGFETPDAVLLRGHLVVQRRGGRLELWSTRDPAQSRSVDIPWPESGALHTDGDALFWAGEDGLARLRMAV